MKPYRQVICHREMVLPVPELEVVSAVRRLREQVRVGDSRYITSNGSCPQNGVEAE